MHLAVNAPDRMDLTPESTLYFAVGNSIHDAIRKALEQSKVLVANEVRITFGPIHGFIDDIIISAETGGLKIIDVKTCGQLPNRIKSGQGEQLLLYALLTGISEASIVYVSRNVANFNGLMLKEIPALINGQAMEKVARVIAESLVYSERHLVVGRPEYRLTRETCGWCPFKDNGCYGTGDGILPLDEADGWHYGEPDTETEIKVAQVAENLLKSKSEFYMSLLDRIKKYPGYKNWSGE